MIKRINWVDWAKAVTITLMVLGHFPYRPEELIFRDFIYTFHMPLFYILAGFLFKQPDSLKSAFTKGVTTLLVPYILLNAVLFFVFHFPDVTLSSLKEMGFYFITAHPYAPAGGCWFLVSLFLLKLLAYAILKLKKKTQQMIAVAVCLLVAYSITYILQVKLYFTIDTTLYAIVFFLAGYYLKENYAAFDKLKGNKILIVGLAILSVGLLYLLNCIQGRVDLYSCLFGNYPALYYPTAFIGSLAVILFCLLLDNIESYFIKVISTGTLVILAFHGVMIGGIYKIINYAYPAMQQPNTLVNIGLTMLIVLALFIPILFIKKYFPILIGNRT